MISHTPTPRFKERNQSFDHVCGFLLRSLLLIALLAGNYSHLKAQEPSPTPTPSAQETRLKEENKILELEKTNAEFKKNIREAQPQPTTTPLEGKTTLDDNVFIETHMVTFKAMSNVADKIAEAIYNKYKEQNITIAIYNAADVSDLSQYQTAYPVFKARVEAFKRKYAELKKLYSDWEVVVRATLYPAGTITAANTSINTTLEVDPSGTISVTASGMTNRSAANIVGSVNTAASAVTGTLRTFADLLAIFRTDTEIKGKSVSIEEAALVSETFRALKNKFGTKVTLYYPKIFVPQLTQGECIDSGKVVFCSPTLKLISNLYEAREDADTDLLDSYDVTADINESTEKKTKAEQEIKELDAKIGELRAALEKTKNLKKKAAIQKEIDAKNGLKSIAQSRLDMAKRLLRMYGRQKFLLDQMQALNQQVDSFIMEFTKSDDKTGRSTMTMFIKGENLEKALEGDNSYWLELKSLSAGGNNRTRKNLIRYFTGAKVDYSGGVIVEWQLLGKKGGDIDSNKDQSYEGYKSPKEIINLKDKVTDPQ